MIKCVRRHEFTHEYARVHTHAHTHARTHANKGTCVHKNTYTCARIQGHTRQYLLKGILLGAICPHYILCTQKIRFFHNQLYHNPIYLL